MEQLDLSGLFQTKVQATNFVVRLETISEKIYQTKFNLEKVLLEQFGIKTKDALLATLLDNKVDIKSNAALSIFFNKIKEEVSTLPVLTLTIAFEPKEKILKELCEWFVQQTKKQILLDITVDPSLIAGATISVNGKYLDCSIKPLFDKVIEDVITNKQKANVPMHQTIEHMSI